MSRKKILTTQNLLTDIIFDYILGRKNSYYLKEEYYVKVLSDNKRKCVSMKKS